jgi:uncharacterized protein (DUF433 family)
MHKGAMPTPYQDILTIAPGKRGGTPCIRGMRITVYEVLSYLAAGMTHKESIADFPYLTQHDIPAYLSYAASPEGPARLSEPSTKRSGSPPASL